MAYSTHKKISFSKASERYLKERSHLMLMSKAINDTLASYKPEYANIRPPVLSFFIIRDGSDFLSSDYMTEEQKAQVLDYLKNSA